MAELHRGGGGVRNWRTPGYRALGLRRADILTGGPVSVRGAVIQQAVVIASTQLRRQLLRPWRRRSQKRMEAMRAKVKQAQREHPGDHEAQRLATQGEFGPSEAAGSCGPPLAAALFMQSAVLWSPLNQTIAERLAGTIVVIIEE